LIPRADRPFEILERVNNNAYKVNFLGDCGVSATFNVADLSPYLEDDHLANSTQILLNKERMMEGHPWDLIKSRKVL